MELEGWMKKALQQRSEKGTLRNLSVSENKIDFVSNDYLGLAQSEKLYQLIEEKYKQLQLHRNGSTGSRLLAGNSALADEIEFYLAKKIFKSEKALLFNSGYTANLAVLSCIPQKGDVIFYDELVHACMHDGAKLSKADRISFKHNDLIDLESKFDKHIGSKFIAVESIYSMDGDQCPLVELVALAKKYNAVIILDEAHSTGSYGGNGSGLACTLGVASQIDIRIYTFGKAIGVHGACVAGSEVLTHYLINFARPFIYTTAPTPHSLISIQCAFEFLQQEISLQQKLKSNINYFLGQFEKVKLKKLPSNSAIQSILIKGNDEVKMLDGALQNAGLDCRAIRSPTVKAGAERIRICLHAYNTTEEIDKLIFTLKEFSKS